MFISVRHISPLLVAHDRQAFDLGLPKLILHQFEEIESKVAETTASFVVEGYCIPCGKTVPFAVDMVAGGRREGGKFVPNWRERLVCPSCKMSNRQRLMAALLIQQLQGTSSQNVYLMEQTTSLYRWVAAHFPEHTITGSEYLGHGYRGGEAVKAWHYHNPLRKEVSLTMVRHKVSLLYAMLRIGGLFFHEDLMNLSFGTGSLDMIVSNDVFEHVPDPVKAFAECFRVLRPGGMMLASIPFHSQCDMSVTRAESGQKGVRHLLPPVYHGNPVSAKGSLVFTDFGWDVIQSFQTVGFSDVVIEEYASAKFGHLGSGLLIFRMKK
jgi:hypothetical protein